MLVTIKNTTKQTNLYPKPENIGSPANDWATPVVKGLNVPVLNPIAPPSATILTPTIAS